MPTSNPPTIVALLAQATRQGVAVTRGHKDGDPPRIQAPRAAALLARALRAREDELTQLFNWKHANVGNSKPCVLCGGPAILRDPVDAQPCHKLCVEPLLGIEPFLCEPPTTQPPPPPHARAAPIDPASIPNDLIDIQRAITTAHAHYQETLAGQPSPLDIATGRAHITDAQRQASDTAYTALLAALRAKHQHPWWTAVGNRASADHALNKAATRSHP